VVTVIVAEPAATAVTSPVVAFTVAIVVALLLHATVLLVALAGATVAVRVWLRPLTRLRVVGVTVTPVTATVCVPGSGVGAGSSLPHEAADVNMTAAEIAAIIIDFIFSVKEFFIFRIILN
jgi:hypothetical protein